MWEHAVEQVAHESHVLKSLVSTVAHVCTQIGARVVNQAVHLVSELVEGAEKLQAELACPWSV